MNFTKETALLENEIIRNCRLSETQNSLQAQIRIMRLVIGGKYLKKDQNLDIKRNEVKRDQLLRKVNFVKKIGR